MILNIPEENKMNPFTRKLIVCSAIFFTTCLTGDLYAQEQMQMAADSSLIRLHEIVTIENYSMLGFKTFDEARLSSLGIPLQEYFVRLDQLRDYKEGTLPDSLLKVTNIFIYPVMVNNEVRSSVELLRHDKSWEVSSFGSPKYIQLIADERNNLIKLKSLKATDVIIVDIPSLNLNFLGYYRKKELMLVPVTNYPQLDLVQGKPVPARELFLILAPLAQKHNGLPG